MNVLFFFLALLINHSSPVIAQKDIVDWSFVCKKISDDTYEIRLQANVPKGWHIYSQNPGEGPLPTTVTFTKSPVIRLVGEPIEVGRLKSEQSDVFNSEIGYYETKLVLIQRIKLKAKVKTTINGNIDFMVCNAKQCLPPKRKVFNIAIPS